MSLIGIVIYSLEWMLFWGGNLQEVHLMPLDTLPRQSRFCMWNNCPLYNTSSGIIILTNHNQAKEKNAAAGGACIVMIPFRHDIIAHSTGRDAVRNPAEQSGGIRRRPNPQFSPSWGAQGHKLPVAATKQYHAVKGGVLFRPYIAQSNIVVVFA
jgi:hypothetical protein